MKSKPDILRSFELREAALLMNSLLTNDLVRVDRQTPKVNGRLLKLNTRAFVLLLLLAEQAVATPGAYLPTSALVDVINRNAARLGKLGLSWQATKNDVYGAVSELRSAIETKRLNATLVERNGAAGYRLSTAPANILISVPGQEDFSANGAEVSRSSEFPILEQKRPSIGSKILSAHHLRQKLRPSEPNRAAGHAFPIN
jgi:hypothetical protein